MTHSLRETGISTSWCWPVFSRRGSRQPVPAHFAPLHEPVPAERLRHGTARRRGDHPGLRQRQDVSRAGLWCQASPRRAGLARVRPGEKFAVIRTASKPPVIYHSVHILMVINSRELWCWFTVFKWKLQMIRLHVCHPSSGSKWYCCWRCTDDISNMATVQKQRPPLEAVATNIIDVLASLKRLIGYQNSLHLILY